MYPQAPVSPLASLLLGVYPLVGLIDRLVPLLFRNIVEQVITVLVGVSGEGVRIIFVVMIVIIPYVKYRFVSYKSICAANRYLFIGGSISVSR